MKPLYCNNTTIDCNGTTGEVSLTFSHIYTDHNFRVDSSGLTDVSARMVEEEAHVIMSRESFLAFKRAVDTIAEKMGC